jgi:hypothetical protein
MEITKKQKERFYSKVEFSTVNFWNDIPCLEWKHSLDSSGYGHLSLNSLDFQAHRLSWIMTNGEIRDGLHVLHHCDNRKCVNPEHLFLGTHLENMIDRDLKNRGKNLKGEEQPNSILTDEAVKEIIRLYNTGLFLQREIAEKYGVSTRTISSVTNGERWKHILV